MPTIRNTDPNPRHWSWRARRSGRFVSRQTVGGAEKRALVELVVTMLLEAPYGRWPAALAGANHQDLARNLALQGFPVASGAQPARRASRERARRSNELWWGELR